MQYRNASNFALSLFIILSFLAIVPIAYNVFVYFSVSIVALKLAEWLMTSTRKRFLYKTVCPKEKAVLITGCDSGFGNALAKRMDRLGYKVFAGCLFSQGEGAKDLINSCSRNLHVLSLDVTDDQSIEEAKTFIAGNLKNNVLWAVVNNAGIGHAGEIDWTNFEVLRQVHDVNSDGTLRITKAFLPFIKKSKGRIINNTSISGRFTCPGFVGYCMSKSAAMAFTNGLRIELKKWRVKVISIEPFFYSTPLTGKKAIWELADRTWDKAPKETKEEYGELYKKSFKEGVVKTLSHCNPNIYEVIDCFEDAITAEEPLSSYFPCSFKDKMGIMFLLTLSNSVSDNYKRSYLEGQVKPTALVQ